MRQQDVQRLLNILDPTRPPDLPVESGAAGASRSRAPPPPRRPRPAPLLPRRRTRSCNRPTWIVCCVANSHRRPRPPAPRLHPDPGCPRIGWRLTFRANQLAFGKCHPLIVRKADQSVTYVNLTPAPVYSYGSIPIRLADSVPGPWYVDDTSPHVTCAWTRPARLRGSISCTTMRTKRRSFSSNSLRPTRKRRPRNALWKFAPPTPSAATAISRSGSYASGRKKSSAAARSSGSPEAGGRRPAPEQSGRSEEAPGKHG